MSELTGPQTLALYVLDRTWITEQRWREKAGYAGQHMAGGFAGTMKYLHGIGLVEWRNGMWRASPDGWSMVKPRSPKPPIEN